MAKAVVKKKKPVKMVAKKAVKKAPAPKKATKKNPKKAVKKVAAKAQKRQNSAADLPPGPKHPTSGYMIFCKSKRPAMLKANPNLSIAESGKTLGLEWGKLSDSAKDKYNKTAAGDRARYNTELEAYRSQHGQPPPTKKAAMAAKSVKVKKDPNKPKGALSSYMFFCNQNRERLVKNTATPGSLAESGKILGQQWAKVSEKEKAKYTALAEKDRARYDKEMLSYVPPPEEKFNRIALKKAKDPNKPKGATNAYMFFNAETSAGLRAKNPGIKVPELGKIVGEEWRALSEKKKEKYVAMAAKDKARYDTEMAKYTPP